MVKSEVTGAGVFKRFFAVKYRQDESLRGIFRSKRIWGALLGELVGTMLLTMLFMTVIGVFWADMVPVILCCAILAAYLATVRLSGANLNPLVTAGMMATRRMSVVRGILYMVAQLAGAWLGFLILRGFEWGSGMSGVELPLSLIDASGENFWLVMFVELMGAMILGFGFARALGYTRKSPAGLAVIMASLTSLLFLLGIIISSNFYMVDGVLVFNPAAALMYGLFPTMEDGFGAWISAGGLSVLAYVVVPMIGGVIGFFVSDLATRMVGDGYEVYE